MIIANGVVNDETKQPVILLGLTKKNCARLLQGERITVKQAHSGFAGEIIIIAGEDDLTISRDIQSSLNIGVVIKPAPLG